MESKPLSSLYLCGDDSDENSYGGIAGFDNVDVPVPDNLDYNSLQKSHQNCEMNAFFPNSASVENFPSSSVEAGPSRQPNLPLTNYDSSTFTSQDSSSSDQRVSDTVSAETSLSDSLTAEKITNADLAKTVGDHRLSKNRYTPTSDVGDLEMGYQRSSVRSNSDCSNRNVDVQCEGGDVTGYEHTIRRKRNHEDSKSRFLNGEMSSNEESDDIEDFNDSMMMEGIDAEKMNEDDEEMEEEGDDEEDYTEDEEEEEEQDEESPKMEENVADDDHASEMPSENAEEEKDKINEPEYNEDTGISQQPDLQKMEDMQNLPAPPERPTKKKKVPTATLR